MINRIHWPETSTSYLSRREYQSDFWEENTKAEQAYTAYCQHTGWKSLVTNSRLPDWVNLPTAIQAAWRAAVRAIL